MADTKRHLPWIFFLPVLALFACGENKGSERASTDSISNVRIPQPVVVDSIRYDDECYVYLPEKHPSDSIICLLFFDPQGKGSIPVQLYSQLARQYGMMLAGSNRSRNGLDFQATRAIAQNLIKEVSSFYYQKFKHISFYSAGFSGGAKVALDAANAVPELKGVVYAGAPAASTLASVPLYGFVGDKDMNLADVVQFDASIPPPKLHFLRIWEGKHDWPASSQMKGALEWISIREAANRSQGFDLMNDMVRASTNENDLLKKEEYLLKARFLSQDLNLADKGGSQLNLLHSMPSWRGARNLRAKEYQTELAMKEDYSQAFFKNDVAWWKGEIDDLKQHRKDLPPAMQDRLLGFFSLAGFSLSNRSLQENEEPMAEKMMEIYRLSDPNNPEQAYLRAVLSGRRQHADLAMGALTESLSLGFSDKTRIQQQPEFQFLQASPAFQKLLKSIK
jgi:hypothetical protein